MKRYVCLFAPNGDLDDWWGPFYSATEAVEWTEVIHKRLGMKRERRGWFVDITHRRPSQPYRVEQE